MDNVEIMRQALRLGPGDAACGGIIREKGVSNGVFGFWLVGGGFVSLPNTIASMGGQATRLERALAVAREALKLIGDGDASVEIHTEVRVAESRIDAILRGDE